MEKHFLQNYSVHHKPEAVDATKKKERHTGKDGLVRDYDERITAYIERLRKIFLDPGRKDRGKNERAKRRNLKMLMPFIHEAFIIKKADFPENHFEHQKLEFRNRGMGDVEFSAQDRQNEIARVQESQKRSLDVWIDHLSSDDSHYPADIKYFAMQGILRIGSFDKDNYRFSKRTEATIAPFYQIDHESLSMVMGALEAVHHHGDTTPYHQELLDLIKRNQGFGNMYAETMRYLDKEGDKDKALEITDGEWRVFKQGSDPQKLVKAFAGKRAYLCLGNIGDASGYLARGDVQVYFSNNRAGVPVWPRVAIAVEPDEGAYEMRGTYNANEDIDPEISQTDIIKNRLATVPNGESFAKKDADMKRVTNIYNKCFRVDKKTKERTYLKPTLTRDELVFLYEINSRIQYFGYQKDPRIKEILNARDVNADLPTLFDCEANEIAWGINDVSEKTKVYIGPLFPGIFDKQYKYIYTHFPDKRVEVQVINEDNRTKKQLYRDLKRKGFDIKKDAKDILEYPEARVSKEVTNNRYAVINSRSELGPPGKLTMGNINKRAIELGLVPCSPKIALYLREKLLSQESGERIIIGMHPVYLGHGIQGVLSVGCEIEDGNLYVSTVVDEETDLTDYHVPSKFIYRLPGLKDN